MADWYSVRCVFEFPSLKTEGGKNVYEERITIWQASSLDDAIAKAEIESRAYASENNCVYLGLAQAYDIPGVPGEGAEIYSLIRSDKLASEQYLDKYFDTGSEHQGHSD